MGALAFVSGWVQLVTRPTETTGADESHEAEREGRRGHPRITGGRTAGDVGVRHHRPRRMNERNKAHGQRITDASPRALSRRGCGSRDPQDHGHRQSQTPADDQLCERTRALVSTCSRFSSANSRKHS